MLQRIRKDAGFIRELAPITMIGETKDVDRMEGKSSEHEEPEAVPVRTHLRNLLEDSHAFS